MSFCTRCGQELIDGQEHICPADNNTNTANYEEKQNRAFSVNGNGETIGVSINKEAVQQKYNNFKSQVDSAASDFQNANLDSFERGKRIVPDIIAANDGEVPIKQYNIAKLRTRITLSKAEGRLQVTNKRVIFRATGRSIMGKVTLHEEFSVSELAGAEFRNRPEFNIFNFFVALIITGLFGAAGFGISNELENGFFTFLAIVLALVVIPGWFVIGLLLRKMNSYNKFYVPRLIVVALIGGFLAGRTFDYGEGINYFNTVLFGLLDLLALINVLLIAFVPNLVIKIKTKGSHSGIEVMKEEPMALLAFLFGKAKEDNSGFLEVLPWVDTDIAIKEFGTMIDDINTLGDAAIEKWKQD